MGRRAQLRVCVFHSSHCCHTLEVGSLESWTSDQQAFPCIQSVWSAALLREVGATRKAQCHVIQLTFFNELNFFKKHYLWKCLNSALFLTSLHMRIDMYLISLKKISICVHLVALLGRELSDDREAPYRACCAGSPQWWDSTGNQPHFASLLTWGHNQTGFQAADTEEQRDRQFPSCLLFPSDEPSFQVM